MNHAFAPAPRIPAALATTDQPIAAKAGAQYTVYLDGLVATCGRTHFTLIDLRSQSDYQADVFFGHQCGERHCVIPPPVKTSM